MIRPLDDVLDAPRSYADRRDHDVSVLPVRSAPRYTHSHSHSHSQAHVLLKDADTHWPERGEEGRTGRGGVDRPKLGMMSQAAVDSSDILYNPPPPASQTDGKYCFTEHEFCP